MDVPERPFPPDLAPDPAPNEVDQPVAVIPVVDYVPSDRPSFAYAPPAPPAPAGPPKSVAGAALLNLTGLGLGYAYLRNRVLAVIALGGTAVLVTGAFLADAATQPWLWRGVALGWLAGLAMHAAHLATRRAPGPRRRTPVLAGAVAVAVLVAGYAGYGVAGAAAHDRGVTAQANGDCVTANEAFDAVTGPFALTLSADVLDARECADYEKARAAQRGGDYDRAITLYNDFGKVHPGSTLASYVHTNLADAHFANATSWQPPVSPVDARVAVDTLLMLGREFADTDAAGKTGPAIAEVFAAATQPYAAGKFCDSLTVLAYFAGLSPSSAGEKVVAEANTYRARSLYECGLSQARDGLNAEAISTLEIYLAAYPGDGGVPQATAALIGVKVAVAVGVRLPVPPPLGGNEPGSIPMTFYNDSNVPLTVLVAGPTAHQLTIPACATCPAAYVKDDPAACEDLTGRPSVTLRLPPATYHYTTDDPDMISQATGSITPAVGYEHWQCVYVVRH